MQITELEETVANSEDIFNEKQQRARQAREVVEAKDKELTNVV